MKMTDRYASAVRSSNLKSKPDTTHSDSDVLGAMGLASKKRPLSVALMRLFSGDNRALPSIVEILGAMVDGRGFRTGVSITRPQAKDLSRAVLAWHLGGRCKRCNGLGFKRLDGAPSLSGHACEDCRGTRMLPFDPQFLAEHLELALWLRDELEREIAIAGAAASQALAPVPATARAEVHGA